MPQTLWTQLGNLQGGDEAEALAAAEVLCKRYREPIINWLKRSGLDHHDAEDVAHDFVPRFFTPARLGRYRRTHAKFRSFLLTALRHFVISYWRKRARNPLEHSGTTPPADALEDDSAEIFPPTDPAPADKVLDRDIADDIHTRVLSDLAAAKYAKPDQAARFEALRHLILDEPAPGEYESLASRLSLTTNHVRQLLFRLRDAHYDAFRAEVADLVEVGEVDAETRYLLGLLIE